MGDQEVRVRLNQQQLELLDRTVADTGAASREDVLLRALRDHATGSAEAPAAQR